MRRVQRGHVRPSSASLHPCLCPGSLRRSRLRSLFHATYTHKHTAALSSIRYFSTHMNATVSNGLGSFPPHRLALFLTRSTLYFYFLLIIDGWQSPSRRSHPKLSSFFISSCVLSLYQSCGSSQHQHGNSNHVVLRSRKDLLLSGIGPCEMLVELSFMH